MTNQEIYYKLLEYVKERADEKTANKSKKKIYYISAEFLIGKLLVIKPKLNANGKTSTPPAF